MISLDVQYKINIVLDNSLVRNRHSAIIKIRDDQIYRCKYESMGRKKLTNLPLALHVCVSESGQQWLR